MLYLDLFGFGRRRAASAFPGLAEELGLEFRSAAGHKIGEAHGEINGVPVTLAPDRRATIHVGGPFPGEFRLGTSAFRGKPFPGLQRFDTGTGSFDRVFRTRFAAEGTVERFTGRGGEVGSIPAVISGLPSSVKYVQITNSGIRCAFKHGSSTYLDPRSVRLVLPRLLSIASDLSRLLEGGTDPAPGSAEGGLPRTDGN